MLRTPSGAVGGDSTIIPEYDAWCDHALQPFMVLAALVLALSFCMAEAYDGVRAEPVIQNLDTPWDVAFGENGWVYVTTRPGILYGMHDGRTVQLLSLSVGGGEGGMLGVAARQNMVYVYHTDPARGNQVSRYVHDGDSFSYNATVIQDIPAAPFHNGGRIRFGPDLMLYVGTGDAGDPALSQDLSSTAGKILRLNPDGTIPSDNPLPGSPVYAYGLRNPQGLAWDGNGTMYVTDHGPSGFFERAHDEINRIIPLGNYGWPDSVGDRVAAGTLPPLIHSGDDTWAPSGLAYAANPEVVWWEGMLVYGALRGEHLGVVSTDGSYHSAHLDGELGRIRAPLQHPNGTIYLITSNTDGRGMPSPGDDMLLRVVPEHDISDAYDDTVRILWDLYRGGMIAEPVLRAALGYVASLD